MTNYNDFDLDMQSSQSQNNISPKSSGSVLTTWDCATVQLTEHATNTICTNQPTLCWECETSEICGDGSGDQQSISQCRSYCGSAC